MTNDEVQHKLRYLIGSSYVSSLKAYISELTGRAHVVGPNEGASREWDPNRIRVVANACGTIESFRFG
ncbi:MULTISPECIES: hypothetical protein [Pseudomonas]|uniref:Peptidase inhibitor I78 family protein n=1 Tax=Pseudomonas fluorescens TaxID=294 RepID=A0A0N9W7X0_PSEFL|nr:MULTISPECIES: hypothetical protein [Pseudomonas]ALI07616.1 hypothetical protein AO356_12570 [Pseudomonas fluorescens]